MEPNKSNQPQQTGAPTQDSTQPKLKRNRKKIIIALIVLAVLLGAGVAAYIFSKDEAEPASAPVSTTESKDANIQVGEYLEIPEIGVRLKLPAEIKDAYYIIDKNFTDNNRDWAFISTKTLKDLDSGCSAEDESRLAPGYVSYFTDPNEPFGPGDGSTISMTYKDNFKLGDKYVFYSTYQQSPCYQPETTSAEKTAQIDSIYKSFKQARIEGINSPKTDPATPTTQDVLEIKKTADSLCSTTGGYGGEEITLKYLQSESGIEGVRYYNNYALIAIGCKGENGGYMSFMQKQSDGSYKHLAGAQDILDCERANQYKIPKQILPTCITNQGQDEVPNTN